MREETMTMSEEAAEFEEFVAAFEREVDADEVVLPEDKVNSAESGREGPLGGKVNSAESGREGPLGHKVNAGGSGGEGPLGEPEAAGVEAESRNETEQKEVARTAVREAPRQEALRRMETPLREVRSAVEARTRMLLRQGVPEQIARHTARIETENAQLRKSGPQAQDTENMARARCKADIGRLYEHYPEVRDGQVPEGMMDAVRTGMTPLEFMQQSRLKTQERELESLRQYKLNRRVSPGGVKGGAAVKTDEFTDMFWSTLSGD